MGCRAFLTFARLPRWGGKKRSGHGVFMCTMCLTSNMLCYSRPNRGSYFFWGGVCGGEEVGVMWIEISVAAFPFHLSKFATHPPREIVREVPPSKIHTQALQTTGISYLVILPVFIVDVFGSCFDRVFFFFFCYSPLSHQCF